jgi:micrococcal nuclease
MSATRARAVLVAFVVVTLVGAFGLGRVAERADLGSLLPSSTSATDAGAPAGDAAPPPEVPSDAQPATVARIVDGDTLRVAVASDTGSIPATSSVPVRLLNVDTPETRHPDRGVECGGPEATARVEQLLAPGDRVWLVADRSDTDRFERHLRAVWTADGTFLNALLVEEGLGRAVLFPPDDRWYATLVALEDEAVAHARGIWGPSCHERR